MATKTNFGSVFGTPWADAYIVGGGPSLRGFDFGRLCGRTVIAVNDAALHVPFATALFSLDATWIRNRRELITSFAGEKYLAVAEDFDFSTAPPACYLLRSRHGKGLSDNPQVIHMGGGNSGFGALNLAYLRGAERIVLLGYDLCHSGTHWHAGYVWQATPNDHMYQKWAGNFSSTVRQLAMSGTAVWNACSSSQITAFPHCDLSQVPFPLLEAG